MLKQRVLTALVLVALLLPTLATQAVWPFMLFMGVAMTAATWEWARLNGWSGSLAAWMAAVVACAMLLLGWRSPQGIVWPGMVWWMAGAAWVLAGAVALRVGPDGWGRLAQIPRLLLGPVMLVLAWVAMVQARVLGLDFLMSVFCLVWMADISAYFGGRALGKRKLALHISPGKSWEGAWSGLAGVLALATTWVLIEVRTPSSAGSVFTQLWQGGGWLGMAAGLLVLVAMSVVGDLFESLVKRSAGAKDSSALLPGHGGVLDRIDALLPVFPLALAMVSTT